MVVPPLLPLAGGTIWTLLFVNICLTQRLILPASLREKTTYLPSGEIEVLPSITELPTRPPLVSRVNSIARKGSTFALPVNLYQPTTPAVAANIKSADATTAFRCCLMPLTRYSALDCVDWVLLISVAVPALVCGTLCVLSGSTLEEGGTVVSIPAVAVISCLTSFNSIARSLMF